MISPEQRHDILQKWSIQEQIFLPWSRSSVKL